VTVRNTLLKSDTKGRGTIYAMRSQKKLVVKLANIFTLITLIIAVLFVFFNGIVNYGGDILFLVRLPYISVLSSPFEAAFYGSAFLVLILSLFFMLARKQSSRSQAILVYGFSFAVVLARFLFELSGPIVDLMHLNVYIPTIDLYSERMSNTIIVISINIISVLLFNCSLRLRTPSPR
jgi:hypothetical protein